MPAVLDIVSRSAGTTREVGRALGAALGKGDYVCLYGELGAGKTTFVQGIAQGLGVEDAYVTSPSFALVNQYRGRIYLYHIDLYRLAGPEDLDGIGFSEYPGEGAAAVEWPERAEGLLPPERLEVTFEHAGEDTRRISFRAVGRRYESILEGLCQRFR